MRKRMSAACLLMLGLLVYAGAPPPAKAGLFSISERQEIQTGEQASRDLESKYGVSRDSRLTSLVRSIGYDLSRSSDRPNLPWEFKVLNNAAINAVALPGGKVYVFKGLLQAVGNDRDMLAGVMAHEVGHVSAHHHTEMMERQMTSGLAINLLLKGKTRNVAGLFSNIYALKWSRKDEYQADQIGVNLAADAGYDPDGLPRFLRLLQSKYGSGARSGPAAWLSTHPSTSERVRRAYQYAEERGGGRYSESSIRGSSRRTRSYRSAPDLLGDPR